MVGVRNRHRQRWEREAVRQQCRELSFDYPVAESGRCVTDNRELDPDGEQWADHAGHNAGSTIGGTGTLRFPDEAVISAFNAHHQIDVPLQANSLTTGVFTQGGGPGQLNIEGPLALGSISAVPPVRLQLDLNGTDPLLYDRLTVTDFISLSPFNYDIHVGYPAQFGDTFTVMELLSGQPIFLSFALPEGSIFSSDGYQFRVSYVGGTGNDLTLTVVPEPAVGGVVGLFAMLCLRRARRDSSRRRRGGGDPASA
jgi:hypothetical protein